MARGAACCALALLAALAACKREPTFDERYAGAQKAIRDKASELDRDMATRSAEADEVVPQGTESASPTASGVI